VYARDSRDADLLYRAYRMLLLRGPSDTWPSASLQEDVEHQAFLLLLAGQGEVACPRVELVTRLPDGSMALVLEHVTGTRLDQLPPEAIDASLLDAVWTAVQALHRRRLAHRALRGERAGGGRTAVLVDFGFGEDSATPRMQAIDRAELLTSLAVLVGPEPAVAAGLRVLGPADLVTTLPYLQPLALSAGTRRAASKTLLRELRASVESATGHEPVALERLVRVRPRTLLAPPGRCVHLLLRSSPTSATASWRCGRRLGMARRRRRVVHPHLGAAFCTVGRARAAAFVPTNRGQMASSFVNRITPANVGGMLNVRFMQRQACPRPRR
jgi:undecaprenyl-diphosphatase